MPFIPRRSGFAVPPELMQPAREPRPPIPVPAAKEVTEPRDQSKRNSLGLPKLSLHSYEPDQAKILTALFGSQITQHPETGVLRLTEITKPPGNPSS